MGKPKRIVRLGYMKNGGEFQNDARRVREEIKRKHGLTGKQLRKLIKKERRENGI